MENDLNEPLLERPMRSKSSANALSMQKFEILKECYLHPFEKFEKQELDKAKLLSLPGQEE